MLKNTNNINGWLVIDKPLNIGSTTVVSKIKWSLSPSKIGHAGTLDPLATGILPIALGKATKLIPFVMDGHKVYDFQITWGSETTTDDMEGAITNTSDLRPTIQQIQSVLPDFIGTIDQLPPAYSALKVDGKRAYDMARSGQEVTLKSRPITIYSLKLLNTTPETADFQVHCGKGTYVRSLARDIGRKLGCLGHVSMLRRIACGPFTLDNAVSLDDFQEKQESYPVIPMETALDDMPLIEPSEPILKRLQQGQRIPLKQVSDCLSMPINNDTIIRLVFKGQLLGLIRVENNILHPYRIFNQ